MDASALGGSGNQEWATPRWFLEEVHARYGWTFSLDVCASGVEVACAPTWHTPEQDGLAQPFWTGHVWCNPPWEDPLPWIHMAAQNVASGDTESATFLLPAKTDTKWFKALFDLCQVVIFVTPRLNYWNPETGHLSTVWKRDRETGLYVLDAEGEKIEVKSGIGFGSVLARVERGAHSKVVSVEEFKRPKGAER